MAAGRIVCHIARLHPGDVSQLLPARISLAVIGVSLGALTEAAGDIVREMGAGSGFSSLSSTWPPGFVAETEIWLVLCGDCLQYRDGRGEVLPSWAETGGVQVLICTSAPRR